eukprot:5902391-Prymnesium_polylepis.1
MCASRSAHPPCRDFRRFRLMRSLRPFCDCCAHLSSAGQAHQLHRRGPPGQGMDCAGRVALSLAVTSAKIAVERCSREWNDNGINTAYSPYA